MAVVAAARTAATAGGTGSITPTEIGAHELVIDAWTDRYATWRHEIEVKVAAGQDVELELEEGALLLEDLAAKRSPAAGAAIGCRRRPTAIRARAAPWRSGWRRGGRRRGRGAREHGCPTRACRRPAPHPLWVDRPARRPRRLVRAVPPLLRRLQGAAEHLPYVADLGFDVVYLPPIHPIGTTHRKGRDNSLTAVARRSREPLGDRLAPTAATTPCTPTLGTIDDFDAFVAAAAELGLEVALDYALQCSPDHPWVRDHPEWFTQRPDGSIRYAENPPKKYQDIHPIDFWPADGRRPRRPVGGVPRRPRALDRATASGRSASTTRTPSRCRSGRG